MPLSIFLFFGNFSILNKITLYIILFIFNYQINHYFSERIHNFQNTYNQYYQAIILELNMLLLSAKNTNDKNCLVIETLSKYSHLIINFNKSIFQLYNGEKLELFSQNLIFYSELFQDYLEQIFNFDFKQDFLNFIIKYNLKFEENFKINLKSLETNLDLFFFLIFFFPILFNFVSGVWTLNWIEISSLLFIYAYFLKYLIKKSIFKDFGLIGVFNMRKTKEKEQFVSFLQFLKKLTFSLELYSPEYALLDTISNLDPKFNANLNLSTNNLLCDSTSLDAIITNIFKIIDNSKISLFKPFFDDIFNLNSKNSPLFFRNLVELISNHLDLENEREITLKSAITKINVLKIILGLVLGVISPFFFQFGILMNQFKIGLFNTSYSVFSIPYYSNMIVSLIFLGLALKNLNYIDVTNKKQLFSMISVSLYLVSFFFTSFFLI